MPTLDIIIPVYNETDEVIASTVSTALAAFDQEGGWQVKVWVVDDGSRIPVSGAALAGDARAVLLRHDANQGYGAALKTGIRAGDAPWIAITDADGTYPVTELPRLAKEMHTHDTVVGIRTGEQVHIPVARRFPKMVLNRFASYLAGARIADLNSGMRIFTRDLAEYLWPLFPPGFSFTSTMTMGSRSGGYRVKEIPIDYFKRTGSSSIAPIRDTIRFFRLAGRLGLLFAPMRIFSPVAMLLFAVGAIKGFGIDYPAQQSVGNLSVALMIASIQVYMMGLLGQLLVLGRLLPRR